MERKELLEMYPEIELLENEEEKEVVIKSYLLGLELGEWDKKGGFMNLPVGTEGLMKPECDISCVTHMRNVARCSKNAAEVMAPWLEKMGYKLDKNFVFYMALLHDVGKLIEFDRDKDGVPRYGKVGKMFCHTSAGAYIVKKSGGDDKITHAVLTHSHSEAPDAHNVYEQPEHILMKGVDLANFESIFVAWHMDNIKLTI